uniref:Hepcidin n=1 Tax=Panagrolaimus sp. ES5 TaxID=591445 RepID=A0AC34GNY7_9BILA
MKTTSSILVLLSAVVVIFAVAVSSETIAAASENGKALDNKDAIDIVNPPMKDQHDVQQQQQQQLLNNKFGPKFWMNLKKSDGSQKSTMCCECPQGACRCCPIFGGFCCDE